MSSAVTHSSGAVIKGTKKVDRWLKNQKKIASKAMNTAIRVEGFRLKNLLQKEIRQGAPGGKPLAPLSDIAKRMETKIMVSGGNHKRQNPNRKRLVRMATGIRYRVEQQQPFKMAVGFVTPKGQYSNKKEGTWRWLAKKHAKGFNKTITPGIRRAIRNRGVALGKIEGGTTPFFLKKNTRRLRTPATPLVDMFYAAHGDESMPNIRKNFNKKLKGKRI